MYVHNVSSQLGHDESRAEQALTVLNHLITLKVAFISNTQNFYNVFTYLLSSYSMKSLLNSRSVELTLVPNKSINH